VQLSVAICTYNPDRARLQRTLDGLARQTLSATAWELVIVDNNSSPPVNLKEFKTHAGALRVVRESRPGLSFARRTAVQATQGELIVFVDDDNVLADDYLEASVQFFHKAPRCGAAGGRSLPEYETLPQPWQKEFEPLLALRDLGGREIVSEVMPAGAVLSEYPSFAPIGAGMVVRRPALVSWLQHDSRLKDRTGHELTSAGDNEIVLHVLRSGWTVAYAPQLKLTHLIPKWRLQLDYLCRLNRGIQRSWVQVLAAHGLSTWPPIRRWTLPLRRAKAWLRYQPWRGPAERVRWYGACGHFEGRACGTSRATANGRST
jgi:glycosyltransferase involved in cell wall biosynthesis